MSHNKDVRIDNLHKSNALYAWFGMDNSLGQFFLNNLGDTIFFNSVGKMSHIFGPRLDIVSEQHITTIHHFCPAALCYF